MTTQQTPETDVDGAPAGDVPPKAATDLAVTIVTVSDQHLGEGEKLRYMRRFSFVRRFIRWLKSRIVAVAKPPAPIEVDNPLEDFPYDGIFASFLDKVVEKYGSSDELRIMLMGDCFDPLAVTYQGRFKDPPYETAAVYKMRKIIRGHKTYFDKLAEILRLPQVRIDIFAGNHDLFLVWPGVQEAIRKRLAGSDETLRSKIRFIDHASAFRMTYRGVVYDHGMNAEPQNSVNPENVIITTQFGKGRKRKALLSPPGSVMTVEVVNSIKLRNFLVGRSDKPGLVWKNAALHRWGWIVYAAIRLFWFIATWTLKDVKNRWPLTLKMIMATIADDSVDRFAEKILKTTEGIRAVVLGHSHEPRRVTTDQGTYVNTGTWALQYRIVDPKFSYRWEKFRWIEFQVRALQHFLRTGEIPFARQLTKLIGFSALAAALFMFLVMSIPKGWQLGSYHVTDFKWPSGILLVFILFTGVIRLFAGKPKIERVLKPTFGLTRHYHNGDLKLDLMEYDPAENAIRECV